MGNGRLNQDIGYGDATVWNPQVPIQNFNTLLQQKQAKEQSDADAIANELTKVKPTGLRNDADRQSFLKQYQDIKDNAINGQYERDPLKRSLNKAQTRDKLLGLQTFVDQSKQQGQDEHSIMTKLNDPVQRHNYTDASVKDMIANRQLAIDDPNYKKDLSFLQRQVDDNKVDLALKKMHQDALTKVPWSNPIQDGAPTMQGNKKGVITYQKRALSPDQILANDMHMYDVNNDLKQSLEQRYGTLQGQTPAETKALRVRQAAIDRGDLAVGANGELVSKVAGEQNRKFDADRVVPVDNFYAHQAYRQAHPTTIYTQGTPQPMAIPFNGGVHGANVNAAGYVPVNSAALNMAGSPSYNLSTGAMEPQVLSSGDHQLVGAGNFPFIKDAPTLRNKKLIGSISQPNFAKEHPEAIEMRPMLHVQTKDITGQTEDHLVPYDRLPANLPKPTKAALGAFTPAQQKVAQPPASGTVTVQLANGTTGQIPKGKLKDFQSKYPNAKILN